MNVAADVLLGGLEQLSQLVLGQPQGFILQAHLKPQPTFGHLIQQDIPCATGLISTAAHIARTSVMGDSWPTICSSSVFTASEATPFSRKATRSGSSLSSSLT